MRTLIVLVTCFALLFSSVATLAEQSVRPGVNKNYLKPGVNVAEWVKRFEGESREVFAERYAIVRAAQIDTNTRIADIGAGTGAFVPLFAAAAGREGHVYAIDLAPAFVEHLEQRVAEAGLDQVSVIRGSAESINLPPGSIDFAFMCNVYHHIEFPQTLLASVRAALVPGGRMVIVDFERIEGKTRPWIMKHVRAGRGMVTEEIERAGFELVETTQLPALTENYMIEFVRP